MKPARIVAGAAIVLAAPTKPEKIRCKSCGVGWPCDVTMPAHVKLAGRFLCSYCAGDPDWGQDGYLKQIIDDELANPAIEHRRRNLLQLILVAPHRQQRRQLTRQAFGKADD